jgi:hypothetical protein
MPEIHAVARIASSLNQSQRGRVLQAAEKERHQDDAGIVGAAQQCQVRPVDMHQHQHRNGDK